MAYFISGTWIEAELTASESTGLDVLTVKFSNRTRDGLDEYDTVTGEFIPRRAASYQIMTSLYSADSTLGAVNWYQDSALLINLNLDDHVEQIEQRFVVDLAPDPEDETATSPVLTLQLSKPASSPTMLLTADSARTRLTILRI